MAGNTRGRLKERFEGIHRNFDWIQKHLQESLELIKEHNPALSDSIKSFYDGVETLDKLAMDIYSRL